MSEINPYVPPKAEVMSPVTGAEAIPVPASAGHRFLNLLIDYGAQFGIAFLTGIVVVKLWGEAGYDWIMGVPDIVFGLVIALVYYTVFEWVCGRTFGKFITGTKVVAAGGEKLGFGGAIARSLCRLIPFEAFSFLGRETRGWHDSIPNTYVIKCR